MSSLRCLGVALLVILMVSRTAGARAQGAGEADPMSPLGSWQAEAEGEAPAPDLPRGQTPGPAQVEPAPEPSPPPIPRPPQRPRRRPTLYLASAPHMFGDFFNQGGRMRVSAANVIAVADVPVAGGARRIKISENNSAVPMDRVYFMYNHFHNALEANLNPSRPGFTRDFSVERYVIGLEKTFCQGLWSVDLRMPFTNQYSLSSGGFGIDGGHVGNLGIALKRAVAASDTLVLAAGLGIDTPTGSDTDVQILTTSVTVRNDSVHLLPFVGVLGVPSDRIFYHGFLQLDVPTGGNGIDFIDTADGTTGSYGKLTDQTLLYLDAGAGYWLYRNPCSCGLTGVASVLEFHYTTTLQDADFVREPAGRVVIGNPLNRVDVMDVTVGLHAELANRTALRVAGVFPLRDPPDKPFDAEVQISVNRRF